jgi:ATP-binding cassette, subfamily B, bacterial MsbA
LGFRAIFGIDCIGSTFENQKIHRMSFYDRLARVAPYFQDSAKLLFVLLLAVVVAAATEPLIPALMQPLLDQGFQAGKLALWMVPVALLGLFAVRGIAGFCAQYSLAAMSNRTMLDLRKSLFEVLQTAHPSLFTSTTASALVNTVVYEVQIGANLLVNALLSLLKDSLTLTALMGYLLYVNWKLTLIVLAVFPAVAVVMKLLSRRLHRITKASQAATDELAYVVEENVLAYRTVRLHHAQPSQAKRFDTLNQRLRNLAMKSTIANSAMTPLTQMLAAVALSAVICVALWQSSTSGTTVGGFVAFTTAMLMLIAPIKHLSEVAGPITRGLAAIERGLDLMEHTRTEQSGAFVPDAARARGDIQFDNVHVRYANSETDALKALSLQIAPGETVALVGSSGSGKTTLVNLLARFVDLTQGKISVDGTDICEWNLDVLRQQLAFVSQDVIMLNDTVAANVALGQPQDAQRIHAALEAANLSDYVAALPLGIESVVGHNASQLSGGQRQRLAIARAIYKNAPILVLDEATSALDTESEQTVKSAMQRLAVGRTTIIIAHRFSTIEHADRIVVMGHGTIVETGTHAQLIAQQGAYARLYSMGARTDSITPELADL